MYHGKLGIKVIFMCSPSQAQVYSCSVDGTVIVWDVPSLKVKKQFHLSCDRLQSIQVYNDALWCGEFVISLL